MKVAGFLHGVARGQRPLALPQDTAITGRGEFQMIQRGEFHVIFDTMLLANSRTRRGLTITTGSSAARKPAISTL